MHRRTIDMKKKSKLICAGVAGLMAVAIVGSMGLAFFSDTGETKASAKAGSVTIDVTDLEIENSGNVNPGDEDPDVPDGSREGTPHDFTFSVTNNCKCKIIFTCHKLYAYNICQFNQEPYQHSSPVVLYQICALYHHYKCKYRYNQRIYPVTSRSK